MATVINNPSTEATGTNTMIMTVFITVIILLLIGFFVWPGWLTSGQGGGNNIQPSQQNIDRPADQNQGGSMISPEQQQPDTSSPDQEENTNLENQINLPDRLDVNLNTDLPNNQNDNSPTTGDNQPTP